MASSRESSRSELQQASCSHAADAGQSGRATRSGSARRAVLQRLEDHDGGQVIRLILRGLGPKSLVCAGGVNRKWRNLCEDESLWRSACESNPVLVALKARPTNLTRAWKAVFLQRARAGQLRREAAREIEAVPRFPRSAFLIGIVVRESQRATTDTADDYDTYGWAFDNHSSDDGLGTINDDDLVDDDAVDDDDDERRAAAQVSPAARLPEDGGTGRVIFSVVSELHPTGLSLYEPPPDTLRAFEAMSAEMRKLLFDHLPNMHHKVAVSAFLIRKSDDRMLDLGRSTATPNSLSDCWHSRFEHEEPADYVSDAGKPLESLANWRIEGIHTRQQSSFPGSGFNSPEANRLWVGAALEASILADLPAGWAPPQSHSKPCANKRETVRRRAEVEQSLEFKGIRLGLLENNEYNTEFGSGGEEVWLDDVETFLKEADRSTLWA